MGGVTSAPPLRHLSAAGCPANSPNYLSVLGPAGVPLEGVAPFHARRLDPSPYGVSVFEVGFLNFFRKRHRHLDSDSGDTMPSMNIKRNLHFSVTHLIIS